MIKRSLLTKTVVISLTIAMVFASGCEKKDNSEAKVTVTPTSAPVANPTEAPVEKTVPWDGSYIEKDDYRAYIAYDLQDVANSMLDQVTTSQKPAVEKALTDGIAAIEKADTIEEIQAAYSTGYNNILAAVPLADGLISLADKSYAERTEILGEVEKYAISTGITGISLYENGAYVMYNPRITLGTENYITGYGFGTLAEGAITADLDYETNPAWKRYYHSSETDDPGTLYYHNDKGSTVGDLYAHIAGSFFSQFMNETKDGYDWVPELAKSKPIAVNDDNGDGTASKWRFEVRTGKDGLKYTTLSSIPSRAAYNNRPVELEDYLTPFKLLLTQSNGLARGSETANATSGAFVGAKDFYNATKDGFNAAAWDKVGIKVYEENGKSYFEYEFTQETNQFYAMYYIASSLYSPIPQSFLDLVTIQNYLGFNKTATETPLDNSLALGAYTLEAWEQDKQIVFKKNPNYVFADTKFSVPGVHYRIFPAAKNDRMAVFNEFSVGHFDSAGIPKEVLDEYRNDPRTRSTKGDSVFKLNANALDSKTWEYYFGENGVVAQTAKEDYWECEPAMSNAHFRKGLSYAINRLAYSNARGSVGTVNYLSSNYMADPENGISYSAATTEHAEAVAALLEGTDGYGYSIELARDYFRMALDELEKSGAYKPGTKENPTVIEIEIAWQSPSDEAESHNEIAQYFKEAFNDDSVSGGKYRLEVKFWVGNVWSDVYYNKMMIGCFDLGMGSVSGNSLNPLDYLTILSADQDLSGGFTLNWGTDTNDPASYPIVYDGKRYSLDAILSAQAAPSIISNGQRKPEFDFDFEHLTKNTDGSYTGSVTFTITLPEKTSIVIDKVVCCNYERYRNGDQQYDEKAVEFEVENKSNGVMVVKYTVPADLAADYKTGSGTSKEPKGVTGFDIYYSITLDGKTNDGLYQSIDDVFD